MDADCPEAGLTCLTLAALRLANKQTQKNACNVQYKYLILGLANHTILNAVPELTSALRLELTHAAGHAVDVNWPPAIFNQTLLSEMSSIEGQANAHDPVGQLRPRFASLGQTWPNFLCPEQPHHFAADAIGRLCQPAATCKKRGHG